MLKLLMLGATSLASVGLLSRADDPPAADPANKGNVEVVTVATDGSTATINNLRTAYVLLRQLRNESLEEQPRELAHRAVVMYRDGVKALNSGDVSAATKLGAASLELAQAVELARVARAGSPDDPELPPPPGAAFHLVTRVDGNNQIAIEPVVVTLPPRINGETVSIAETQDGDSKPKKATVSANVKIGTEDGKDGEHVIVFDLKDDGSPAVGRIVGKGETKREFKIAVPHAEVRKHVLGTQALGNLVRIEAGHEDDAAAARRELQAAYDQIREARAKFKGEETKVYTNAARDLYNAARREAEAGRHARALELTRAATALARVPALLSESGNATETKAARREIRIEKKEASREKKAAEGAAKEERKVRVHVVPHDEKDGSGEKKVEVIVTPKEEGKGDEPRRVRIETRTRTVGPDGKPHEEVKVEEKEIDGAGHGLAIVEGDAKVSHDGGHAIAIVEGEAKISGDDDAGPLVGVGLMLEIADDQIMVRGLVPDGPASKEGTIKEGDRLIGIEVKEGEVTEFKGKELAEVVEFLRGKPDTKARLVILPKDSEDSKVVEIVRQQLQIAKIQQDDADDNNDEEKKDAGDDGDEKKPQAFHFVVPDGGDAKAELKLDVKPNVRVFNREGVRLQGGPIHLRLEPKVEGGHIELKPKLEGERIKIEKAPKPESDSALPPPIDA